MNNTLLYIMQSRYVHTWYLVVT